MILGGGYDPIQVTVMTKGGKIVYEDSENVVGPAFRIIIEDVLN
jgi:hypothetical protein